MIRHDGLAVSWLGYATVRLESPDGPVIYLDPGRYGVLDDYDGGDADLVCVTHDHHYDSDAVRRVAGEDATLVIFEGVNPHAIDRGVDRPRDLPLSVRTVGEEADVAARGVPVVLDE